MLNFKHVLSSKEIPVNMCYGFDHVLEFFYGISPSRNGIHMKAIWEVLTAKKKTVSFLWVSCGFEFSGQLIWHLAEGIERCQLFPGDSMCE